MSANVFMFTVNNFRQHAVEADRWFHAVLIPLYPFLG